MRLEGERVHKPNRSNRFLWCVLFAACPALLAQQFPIIPIPGAPKNVKTLFQDSSGRLWVGGDELASFDGKRFFFLRDFGLPAGAIQSLAEDAGGAIWIGSETGVYRFAGGRVEELAKGFAVSVIAATPDIAIAAVGPAGMGIPASANLVRIRRDGRKWATETIRSLDSAGPLALDSRGIIVFPGPVTGYSELSLQEALKWHAGAALASTRHPEHDETPDVGPRRTVRDRFGCLWDGADHLVRYKCPDKPWTMLPFEAGLNLSESSDGSMLLVGHDVLAAGRPGSFRIATQANGLPALFAAIQAVDGTIWLGGAQGLYRFPSPFRMEYWTARDGVSNPWSVQRIGQDIFAAMDRSVARLSKDRQHWDKLEPFSPEGPVMQLLPLGDELLVATNPGGVFLIRRDGTVVARSQPAPSFYALRLAETGQKEIWMGGLILATVTRAGSRLILQHHQLETQPAGNVLDVQYEPTTHKLWACYVGGLAVRSEDGSWRELTVKDGLLLTPGWSLAALPNGDVWYGYYNAPAIARLRPRPGGGYDVRQYRASDGVPDPETLNFDVDRRGWLWRGGTHGLSVSDPANAEEGRWLFLDANDGLSGEGVNSGSYFADNDGSVWIGSDLSIFHYFPPAGLLAPKRAPDVFLSAFSTAAAGLKMAGAGLEFPRGSDLVAHLGSLQFDRRSALRFRYRIRGESNWQESRTPDLPLGKLTTGLHTLEVQARLFTGPWSSVVHSPFTILRPIWITWPFLLGYFTCAALSMSGAYWLRWKRKADEATLLPDLARWRMGALVPEVHDVTGTLLDDRFESGELLARGGFANVMEGYDHLEKRRCAIKIFRNEIRDKAWVLRTFQQEVAALGKVHHPNVVPIYAHGVAPTGAPYLAMEYVEGRSLREVLAKGKLSPRRTGRALRQLSGALDAIHAQGICHRDVKPENIIVRNEGDAAEELVLIDFSIAIVKDANETLYGLSRAAGTFDYMGPEQAVGYAEPSSDIYSLAKVLIEMLTGQRLKLLLPDAALDLPDRVRELAGHLPVRLSAASIAILSAALEFDPARRPRAACDFAAPLLKDLDSNFWTSATF